MYGNVLMLTLGLTACATAQFPLLIPAEPGPIAGPCLPSVPIRSYSAKVEIQTDVIVLWNEVALKAIQLEKTPPPIAARNLAIVHTAMYDAVNAVYRTHQPYFTSFKTAVHASPETAASVAAHCALINLYPRLIDRFDTALDESLQPIPEGESKNTGIELGRTVAQRMLAWRSDDLRTVQRSAYTPRSAVGLWKPTPPDYRAALLPHWATIRPFAMKKATEFRPAAPPALTSDAFAASYREVKVLGAVNSRVRTRDETEIAHFWADDQGTVTPPGHWNRIAQTVARQRRNTLAENARLFAMLNVALADAAIACWDCKFTYDFWRPVTAIHEAGRVEHAALIADSEWMPLLKTPPFPAYSSGHSTFSGAGAAVLTNFFGTDAIRFTSTSDALPGVTRSFASFSSAAKEAGMSRIYGGIHWSFDNQEGLTCGQKVGDYVSKSFFQLR